MWAFFRILIGGILIVSGLGKILSPYQNFLYVLQAYQLLSSAAQTLVAQIFPWIELIIGTFVLLGLGTAWALRGAVVLFGIFVVVVGQALIRHLPLESCGCFGELIHIKPQMVIVLDSLSLLLLFLLLRHQAQAQKLSIDRYFK